jgi:hypothetical protein
MTPRSSSSGCLHQTACLTLPCKCVQYYWPLTVIPIGMGWSSPSPFQLKNMTCMTSEHPECTVQFSSMAMFGHVIQHSVFSVDSKMNVSMIHQLLKYNGGVHCLNFCNTADGWWQEKQASGYRVHVESTLHKLFISPSCWWGCSKHLLERFRPPYQLPYMKYCARVPGGVHPSLMLGLHCDKHHLSLPSNS